MTTPRSGEGPAPVVYVLAPQFPWPPMDGGRIGICYRIRELARLGYRVHLFATARVDEPVAERTPLHDWCASVTVVRRRAGAAALRAWLSLRPYQVTSRDVPELRAAVRAMHKRDPADLVQCEHSSMGAFRDVPLSGVVRWVLTFHNLEHRGAWNRARSAWKDPLRALLYAIEGVRLWRFENTLVRSGRFDALLFVSARERAQMEGKATRGRTLFATVPTGSDVPPLPPAEQRSARELLFLGSLWYDPNVEGLEWFLQRVWPLVRAAEPAAHLSVVGRGALPRVRGLVQDAAGATLVGEVPEIDTWVARAAGVVVPVRLGAGIKVKVLEALARGAVCICTSHALIGLELPERPVALVADEPGPFAAHCVAALRGDPVARATAQRGRDWVARHYSWDAIGRRLDAVYRQLLGRGGLVPA